MLPQRAEGTPPRQVSRERLLLITCVFPALCVVAAFLLEPPGELVSGLWRIISSRDTLTTDYMGLGSVGAALLNGGLLTLIAAFVIWRSAAVTGGITVACLFLVLGFGLFGKNLLNVWGIVAGVWLYARFASEPFGRHVHTAFFGCALAPVFSEVLFSTWQPLAVRIPLAIVTSLVLGFVLPPLAAHLFHTHQGYSLYNMGFVAGLIGAVIVAVYHSWGFVPDPVFIWSGGNDLLLGGLFGGMFLLMIGLGRYLDPGAWAGLRSIMQHAGQSPTDFVGIAGLGATLVNMGVTGLMAGAYVLAVGSDLNGPTVGSVLTVVGFAAFGKHPRNIIWIMLGVLLASMLKDWSTGDPSAVLAALLGTTLAPVAGRFGWRWGIVAGFVHSSVVQTVGALHAGLVLYNNGFAAGMVAAVLVPIIVALREPRKRRAASAS